MEKIGIMIYQRNIKEIGRMEKERGEGDINMLMEIYMKENLV